MISKSKSQTAVPYTLYSSTTVIWSDDHSRIYEAHAAPFNPGGSTVLAQDESITYDTGRQKFNFCDHVKNVLTVFDDEASRCTTIGTASVPDAITTRKGCVFTPSAPSAPATAGFTEDMKKLAWNGLVPQLNTGFSLANFLFELRDISQLARTARKLTRYLGQMNKALFGTRTAAEVALTYAFGVAPLKSDLESICDLLPNAIKRINEFVDAGKRVQSYHWRYSEVTSHNEVVSFPSKLITETRINYTATLRASYVYKVPNKWKALMRLWGLNITPEVIWNAIPFSFVVDWVVKVNDFLRQLDDDPNMELRIHDYCETTKSISLKREVRSWDSHPLYKGVPNPYIIHVPSIGMDENPVWEWQRSKYVRVPGVPSVGYALPVFDSLSARELVLGGALARVRVRT